jgi:hypothetical protein
VPSVRPQINRLAVLAVGASLLAGAASGCSTTQEKAEKQQARAKHVLETRDARKQKKRAKARQQEQQNGSEKNE